MGLESATYISQLVATNPVGATDPKSQGDDHLRLLKSVLQSSFPNINAAVNGTPVELNAIHGTQWLNANDGSNTAPAFSFSADTNTGMYRVSADALAFTVGGVKILEMDKVGASAQIYAGVDGTASVPAWTFATDPDTGLFRIGSDDLGFTLGGNAYRVGFRSIPQNNQAGNYTLVVTDGGKHILVSSNGNTITVPPGVFGVGDVITLIGNSTSGSTTLARGSGVTMYWAGTNFVNANRTLNTCFVATLVCVSANVFVLSGVGIV